MLLTLRRTVLCLLPLTLAVGAAAAEATLSVDLGRGVRLELVLVKAGSFVQGSPADEAGRGDDEAQRQVTLSRDFYIGTHEVTRGQFARFAQESGYRTEAEKGTSGGFGWDGKALVQRPQFNWRNPGFVQTDEHPVVIVTYDDALAFAAWSSRKAGRNVTLPIEAQWEYAARAGSTSRFHAGASEEEARTIAWFKANAGDGTHPVGQKAPNRVGLHDVAGNVYEWCRDWYGPYAPGPVTDPEERRSTLSDKPRRVLRGGSWLKDAKACRSAARYRNTPGSRNADNGFRVVAAVEAAAVATAAHGREAASGAQTPPPAPPAEGEEPLLLIRLFPWLGAIAGSVALMILLLRRWARGGGLPTGHPGVRARLGPDGFWLSAPGYAAGSTIRYRVVVDGTAQTGEVTLGQGRQFVYTGGRPSSLAVLGVTAAGLPGAPPSRRTSTTTSPDEQEEPTPTPFRGYPSAY